jgi:hypothetical protein
MENINPSYIGLQLIFIAFRIIFSILGIELQITDLK